jgi:hypothetical protein
MYYILEVYTNMINILNLKKCHFCLSTKRKIVVHSALNVFQNTFTFGKCQILMYILCPFQTFPYQKMISIQQIWFVVGSKVCEQAINAIKFLYWLKNFGQAQNILEPVEGQGIRQFYVL